VDCCEPAANGPVRSSASSPERCPIFLRSPELLDEIVADGMLVQVTAGALNGRYGRAVRDLAPVGR
jgi:tyrosine-protein phosphatase YwqE